MGEITDLIIKRWKSKFSFKVKLVIMIFFITLAFSPGVLLTLPPNNYVSEETDKDYNDYIGDILMSGKTNIYASFVHAVLISLLTFILLSLSNIQDILTR